MILLCEAMILDNTFVPTHDPRWYFEPLLSLSFPLSCNCLVTWGEIPLWAEVTRTVSSLPNYGGLDSHTYCLMISKCAKNVQSDLRSTPKGHPSESDHHTLTIFGKSIKRHRKSIDLCSVLPVVDPMSQYQRIERVLTQNLHCALCIFLPKSVLVGKAAMPFCFVSI